MRIGIDAKFFGPKDRGIGRYVENLVKNLEKIDKLNQYLIFLTEERWNEYISTNPNFKKIKYTLSFNKYNLDLMHFTQYMVPPYRGRFIITVHDLIWYKFPILGIFKRLVYKKFFDLALKRAERIIAVSRCTREDILKTYSSNRGAIKINPQKIIVIYEGVS